MGLKYDRKKLKYAVRNSVVDMVLLLQEDMTLEDFEKGIEEREFPPKFSVFLKRSFKDFGKALYKIQEREASTQKRKKTCSCTNCSCN